MIKAERFRIADRPFAVMLDSYRVVDGYSYGEVNAVWFRRRPGVTIACAGVLRDYQTPVAPTVEEFLAACADQDRGGVCLASWNGSRLWCLADEAARAAYKSVLVPMLAAYPAVPPGYDGWWIFRPWVRGGDNGDMRGRRWLTSTFPAARPAC